MDMDLQNVTTRNTGYVPLSELDYIVIDSKKALPIPCLMFALGVLGNMLGIVSLVRYKYRRARPHSPLTCSSAYTPSPNFREKNGDRSRDVSDFNHQQRKVSTGMRNKNDILPGTKRRRKNKFGPFHTLVLALIAVDLAGNLATSPVTLYLYATNTTIKAAGGDALCNYSAFAMMFFGIVTMASLTTMAIERVLSIQCPYFYHRHVTSRTANIAILIILVSSTIFTALPSMGFGTVRPMFPYTWCFADWQAKEPKAMKTTQPASSLVVKAFNFIYAISGIIMIFTTLICNIIVVVGLFKMKSRMATVHGRRKSTVRKETQMIIQLIVMTCIYLICWLPLMIRILDNQITRQRNGEQDRIAIWLAAANPILDPWVYILLRRSVVKRLVNFAKSNCFPQVENNLKVIVNPSSPQNCNSSPIDRRKEYERCLSLNQFMYSCNGNAITSQVNIYQNGVNSLQNLTKSPSYESLYDNAQLTEDV